jgi:DNA-binding response OmpR family regulator
VWGYDWTGGSNVVEVVISSLRRKLGDRAAALETVRGVGYRLRPME